MRLIDADALKEAWCARCDNKHLCTDGSWRCEEVQDLCDMPSIEIVRCKDCAEWSDRYVLAYGLNDKRPYKKFCLALEKMTQEWFYCSLGERRSDG